MAVTLTSTFLGIKYSIPIMRGQGGGAIINTASISGMGGDYGMASYNAAKAGVINLTGAAALENDRTCAQALSIGGPVRRSRRPRTTRVTRAHNGRRISDGRWGPGAAYALPYH
jgi:NAD(P)-dependent dehydrogenase (short-subunit alcohol dehydrogenase family)